MDVGEARAVVLRTLEVATSQDVSLLKPAEHQLKEWERQRGFYSTLQSIYLDHSLDSNVRWLAVVYFKNGIDRYWRKNAPNAICDEERDVLRNRMILNFNEPIPLIATQISVLIGKIARVDCPKYWPELVPTLMYTIKSDDKLVQQRSLLALHHVIKALASKRLLPDRQIFAELTETIFTFTLNLWNTYASTILNLLQSASPNDRTTLYENWSAAQICLKVLRKLFVHGFKEDVNTNDASTFVQIGLQQITHFLEIGRLSVVKNVFSEPREEYITLLTKVLLDALTFHALWFVQFLEPVVSLVIKFNFTNHGDGLIYERFTVNSFILLKDILRCDSYQASKNIEDTAKNSRSSEAVLVKDRLLTKSTMIEITRYLICKYFLYTLEDLSQWEQNPEEFVSEESGDVWKYSLRPCAEVLFLIVVKEHRATVTPFLIEMVKQCHALDPSDLSRMLDKDAVYNAVGLASFDLFDDIDFNQWFTNNLVDELRNPITSKLIQRRVIWLVGQWINVNLRSDLRPAVYELIVDLLRSNHDLVVRLQAANTLKLAIDDFGFKIDQFLPYLEQSFGSLFLLLREVVECETKMQILHVMSFMIERAESAIRPHASALLHYLPQLWAASEDHNLLRCAIITTLINITQGLGASCVEAYEFLLPVIQLSTDVKQPHHVYLLEDALDLWKIMIQCSPQMTPGLLDIYSNMPALLEQGTETLVTCLKIIEAYLFLNAKEFLQAHSGSLLASLAYTLTDIRDEGKVVIHRIIEVSVRLLPVEAPSLFEPLLLAILRGILEREEHSVLMSVNLSIIARIYLLNQEYFWRLVNVLAERTNESSEAIFDVFLEVFIDRVDIIVQPEKRKLAGLAFASMITSDNPSARRRFDAIISMCVEVLHDVLRLRDDSSCSQVDYFLLNEEEQEEEHVDDSEHEKRKRLSYKQDPVYTVSLKDFTARQLAQCQQSLGEANFQGIMGMIDSEITHQLKFLLR